MSVGSGWVGWVGWSYNTDHVTCCPVCMLGGVVWGGVGWSYNTNHLVLSCMSVGLGLGGDTTQTM